MTVAAPRAGIRMAWDAARGEGGGFTHVVPVGASCRVSWQLRRHLGSNPAYPFDWWITPILGLTRYLADPDPARLYDPEDLEEMIVRERFPTVRSSTYAARLFHEFPRATRADGTTDVAPGWRAHISAARARHEHLLRRLRALDVPGNRILFVRHRLGIDEGDLDANACTAALRAALSRQFGAASFAVLLINAPGATAGGDGVFALEFDDPPGPEPQSWRGDDGVWSAAFTAFGLTTRPPNETAIDPDSTRPAY